MNDTPSKIADSAKVDTAEHTKSVATDKPLGEKEADARRILSGETKPYHDGGFIGTRPDLNKTEPAFVTGSERVMPHAKISDSAGKVMREDAYTSAVANKAGMDVAGYEMLAEVLLGAYNQAARGKGKQRHAGNGLPFDKQPIMTIARMSGLGGHVYQTMKKAQEAGNMASRGELDAAIAEFRGIINYSAAAILLIEEIRSANQS